MAPSSASRAAWIEDPAGLRFIRRDLLPGVAAVASVFLVVGIALDRGNTTLYIALLLLAAGQVGLALTLARLGHRIPGPQQLRIVLATTPATFLLLGMAGWSAAHSTYFPVVPAVIAGIVAMVVALTEPVWVLAPWAAASSGALLVGAFLQTGGSASILLPPVSLAGQAGLAWLIRDGIQRYHAERRAVVHQMAGLVPLASPQETADAIARLLQSWDESQLVLVLRFTALGQTVLLAASSDAAAIGLRVGDALPGSRNELLRHQASEGPWLTRWTVRPEDGEYGERIAEAGIKAAAYVPIAHEGRTIGLIVVADSRLPEEGVADLAERLPVLIEVGELAGSLIGPGFLSIDATSAAAVRLDEILASRAFTPVFQPIWHLATGRVVGFEALTRFEGTTPDEVFAQAGLLGRLQELEIATLSAALAAAERLPPNRWLSVNVSPALLADTDTLRRLVAGSIRPIVLELSEHEVVLDYGALTTSLNRMAPWVSLAIDDAGAGFSSLRHILETSPSWVKLDIGLVRGVDSDPARQALVAGLVHFAGQAAIALIAEGIETEPELEMLKSLGVKLGQGFLLARPAPIDDELISSLLRSDRPAEAPAS
jgi:EAL domain-containing protein (putative c-di-GMP-specific phosphodiesterase class I)